MLLSNPWRANVAIFLFLDPSGWRQYVFAEHGAGARQQLDLLFTINVLSVKECYLDGLVCGWCTLVFGQQSVFIIAVLLVWRSNSTTDIWLIRGLFILILMRQSYLINCLLIYATSPWKLAWLLFLTLLTNLTLIALLAFLALAAVRWSFFLLFLLPLLMPLLLQIRLLLLGLISIAIINNQFFLFYLYVISLNKIFIYTLLTDTIRHSCDFLGQLDVSEAAQALPDDSSSFFVDNRRLVQDYC